DSSCGSRGIEHPVYTQRDSPERGAALDIGAAADPQSPRLGGLQMASAVPEGRSRRCGSKRRRTMMATYSIGDVHRREVLTMLAVLATSAVVPSRSVAAQTGLQRTPGQILGPFYPLKPLSATSDLTRVPGRLGRAQGQVLNVMGRVLNPPRQPVREATAQGWQANA